MASLLRGEPVAENVRRRIREKCEALQKKGVIPTLVIVRVGSRGNDIAYERGAVKQARALGVDVKRFLFDETVSIEELRRTLEAINADPGIHGLSLIHILSGCLLTIFLQQLFSLRYYSLSVREWGCTRLPLVLC